MGIKTINDFSKSPIPEQEAILLKLAYQSLSAWELEGQLRLIKQRENAVYELVTNEGQRYALRIHRANYHSNAALDSERSWIKALGEFGLGVPNLIPTKSGQSITIQDSDEIDEIRQIDLLAWVNGEQIGSVEDGLGEDPRVVRKIYLAIGSTAARIHNQATSWELPEHFQRHSWDVDGLVGQDPLWGQFWKLGALSDKQRLLMLEARDALQQDLQAFGQTEKNYSMIHADLVPENILVDGDLVQIIDFDDAGFGWHLFELATALYFIQDDGHYPVAKAALMDGYRQYRELSDEHLESLPMFIAARSLTYLGWVHTRQGTETAIELTPSLIEMSCRVVYSYLQSRNS